VRSSGGVEGAICEKCVEVEEPKLVGSDGRIDEMVGNREASRAALVWIWAMDMSRGRASSSSGIFDDSTFILSRLTMPEKLDENEGRWCAVGGERPWPSAERSGGRQVTDDDEPAKLIFYFEIASHAMGFFSI